MSNYNSLKTSIDANIKQNGNQEITGPILNSVLNQMVNILGTGYQFAGIATLDPATDPGTPDAKVFYIANGKGTYTNFGGLEVTEDEVVVLYWDSSWHKVSTGIASEESLQIHENDNIRHITASERTKWNEKQDALTLTVKDNGNIVIGNIQGQSKEFMPATPSGDPMHYAYVAAGAEWNGTGADIVKTAPWAELADDDADKTVVHKAGYWYLNGLGDITTAQMRSIYNTTINFGISPNMEETFRNASIRTNFFLFHREGYQTSNIFATFNGAKIEVAKVCSDKSNYFFAKVIAYMAYNDFVTRHFIGVFNLFSITDTTMAFENCTSLKTIMLKKLKVSISFPNASMLSCKSILYMIENEISTSPITITLHADAYARAMANADIVAALEAHPNVSLASA